jgi:hypothetical protein
VVVKPRTTEELADWIGIRHRAIKGFDVEEEWDRICSMLGLASDELEAAGSEGCRRFIDIYDRGFHAAEGMCLKTVKALREQYSEEVLSEVDIGYRLTTFSFVRIEESLIALVADKVGCSARDVRSYLESDERNPTLFKAFAYYGIHPIGKGF